MQENYANETAIITGEPERSNYTLTQEAQHLSKEREEALQNSGVKNEVSLLLEKEREVM